MKREVVRDFLNLPGIAGVALMDGRSRPYFCGVDQTLNFQQKEALVQGITQVVETTPDDFESFEFQFTGHQVFIYKLAQGIVLLVLARSNLVYADYTKAIDTLKVALQEDITKAIATFRLLASDITLSSQNYWKTRATNPTNSASSSENSDPTLAQSNPITQPNASLGLGTASLASNGFKKTPPQSFTSPDLDSEANLSIQSNPSLAKVPVEPEAKQESPSPSMTSPSSRAIPEAGKVQPPSTILQQKDPLAEPALTPEVELKEVLAALNHLSQFTTQYLGTAVITNYWKSSRPSQDWLQNFQIDRSAKITFSSPIAQTVSQFISVQQHQLIREWVAAFIKRCSQVIRDFPTIVDQNALDERQKVLLL